MDFVFYIFSLISIVSTIFVIFQTNAVYALLYLIISFLSISAIFFSLGAFFIGSLEVIIYAGAIMVLFVFIIMMLNLGDEYDLQEKKYLMPMFWIVPSILSTVLFFLMLYVILFLKNNMLHVMITDTKMLGMSLFGPYLLLVELLSMMLLSALVVVFHIGKEKNENDFRRNLSLEYTNIKQDENS